MTTHDRQMMIRTGIAVSLVIIVPGVFIQMLDTLQPTIDTMSLELRSFFAAAAMILFAIVFTNIGRFNDWIEKWIEEENQMTEPKGNWLLVYLLIILIALCLVGPLIGLELK